MVKRVRVWGGLELSYGGVWRDRFVRLLITFHVGTVELNSGMLIFFRMIADGNSRLLYLCLVGGTDWCLVLLPTRLRLSNFTTNSLAQDRVGF